MSLRCLCYKQMVNTRRNAAGGNASQGNQWGGNPLPNPPPLTPEQFYNLQMQMMATMTNGCTFSSKPKLNHHPHHLGTGVEIS